MSPRMPRLAAATLAALAASCSSVFSDYPTDARTATEAFEQGDFARSAEQFATLGGTLESNRFLALAEAGMAHHVAGDLQAAIDTWLEAATELDSYGDRPTVSGRTVSEGALSLLLNDKTLPYDGEGFEAALLHGFLAWDFLRLGNLDGAMVEVRRGYEMETLEEGRYGTTYGMNRFARFVAAIAQELDGAPDEAAIDLRRLAEEMPDHPAVRYSLDKVEALQTSGRSEVAGRAELVVVFERGRMPAKQAEEVFISGHRSFGRVSVPSFGSPQPEPATVEALVDGETAGRTETLEGVLAVAGENLNDRIVLLAAKSVGRAVGKAVLVDVAAEAVEEQSGEGWGIVVSLLGSLLATATERADLRSWLTLPQQVQVLRIPVEPGEHHLRLRAAGSGEIDLGIVEFRAGRPVLVGVRSLGGRLHAAPLPGANLTP